jgi:hypothetical protein
VSERLVKRTNLVFHFPVLIFPPLSFLAFMGFGHGALNDMLVLNNLVVI